MSGDFRGARCGASHRAAQDAAARPPGVGGGRAVVFFACSGSAACLPLRWVGSAHGEIGALAAALWERTSRAGIGLGIAISSYCGGCRRGRGARGPARHAGGGGAPPPIPVLPAPVSPPSRGRAPTTGGKGGAEPGLPSCRPRRRKSRHRRSRGRSRTPWRRSFWPSCASRQKPASTSCSGPSRPTASVRGGGRALPDARMQHALAKVRLVRADAATFTGSCGAWRFRSTPYRVYPARHARPRVDHIHAVMGRRHSANIAPILDRFLRHS